ncbi:hypothetical protein [Burkholderia gladioli]|uniref:hypothetical protein n=1 Tax=Burkholderia gladioli TaxID=28095 RepID=UPI002FE22A2E
MLTLSSEQFAAMAGIDAKNYIERIRHAFVTENAPLAADHTLSDRLWRAYIAAQEIGISTDENVAAFLRLEAFSPGFYQRPATRRWLTRPGRHPDERFHDYLRVIRWHINHPDYLRGNHNGRNGSTSHRRRRNGIWAALDAYWRGAVGRSRTR